MHTALTLILLGAVGLQAIAGCCCRAVHIFDELAGPHAEQPLACCGHDHAQDGSTPTHPPCQRCSGCKSIGVYVSTPKPTLIEPDTLAHCPMLAAVPVPVLSLPLAADRNDTNREPCRDLPIYLLKQLFLL